MQQPSETNERRKYELDHIECREVVASLQRFIECGWDFDQNSENQYTNTQLGNPNEDAIGGETIMVFYPDSQRLCVRGNEAEAWYVCRDGRVALDMLPAC